MPLYPERVAADLEDKVDGFEGHLLEDPEVADDYREAATELQSSETVGSIEDALREEPYPGALPTDEFDDYNALVVTFDPSAEWASHEAINDWARGTLEGVTTVASDGSQIDPITEFNVPVGLAQAVWFANHHTADGDYQEDVALEVLSAAKLIDEAPGGRLRVDDQAVPTRRFELETEQLVARIEAYQDADPPPVVFYDGPLLLSFIEVFQPAIADRYLEAVSRLLAASKTHEVPVVGYVAGSRAMELFEMLRSLDVADTDSGLAVRDYRLLEPLMANWGDRSLLFRSHRDDTIDRLETVYDGIEYRFKDRLLFTYLNVGEGAGLDRLEFPCWIQEAGLTEYVLDVARAECGVGRGYPEILQQVDADAVLSIQDRDRFLRLFQDFAADHDLDLEWDNKALSKKRRRR